MKHAKINSTVNQRNPGKNETCLNPNNKWKEMDENSKVLA